MPFYSALKLLINNNKVKINKKNKHNIILLLIHYNVEALLCSNWLFVIVMPE